MPNPGFANSGIQIRSWEGPAKWRVSGYQPDMDYDNTYTGTCYGESYRGSLAGRGEKVVIGPDHKRRSSSKFADGSELAKFIKKHDWNEYDIIARGNHIIEKINGHLMCELTDNDTVARKDGIIALQIHAGPPMQVEFRNIRLKEFHKQPASQSGMKPAVRLVSEKRDAPARAGAKKIVFIAGNPSHGYAEHEHNAGCLLLAKCLNQENVPGVEDGGVQGLAEGSRRPGRRGHDRHLLRRRRRASAMRAPGRTRQADGAGRRPGLHPLRRRGAQGQGRAIC